MKKKTVAGALVLASCITLSATFTGCSLVSNNYKADMEQTIATVNISRSEKFNDSGLGDYVTAIADDTSISKRELVSYFVSFGYTYVSNYGYTYADTFELLVDMLAENAILTQYSVMALLKDKADGGETDALSKFLAYETDVERYEYLLTDTENGDKYVNLAKYSLYSSLNSTIDEKEKTFVDEEDEYTGTETRTTPTNVDTEQDDYYPKDADGNLDYNVYTGYTDYLLADSGAYRDDALDGTNRATRLRAYSSYIEGLKNSYLLGEDENLSDVLSLSYVQYLYVNQLKSQVVSKYYDLYETEMTEYLTGDNYSHLSDVYNKLLTSQTKSYSDSTSDFETALGSMSSTSFVLYSPDTTDSDLFDGANNGVYGFVYNILLPFSEKQSAELTALNSIYEADGDANSFYSARNGLLKAITTEDQRGAWINGATNYSFKASDGGIEDYYGKDNGLEYLFFENNLTDSERYKTIETYDGRYAYNGSVLENEDGSYETIGNKLDIDGMLQEFSAYINYVLGTSSVTTTKTEGYYETNDFYKTEDGEYVLDDDGEKEIDYSKFIYAKGSVNFTEEFSNSSLLKAGTQQYKAMSAVNELQYAYTTDTGVLSQYVGYSVSAYDTSYIKEFEYAAKLALLGGVGSFTVCAGDYGWHIIYVTYAFGLNGGNVYTPDWAANIEVEGTFEYLFFEWLKDTDLSDISSTRESKIVSDYKNDTTVVKYKSAYQNLLDMDSDS